jgi:hypothetical protein
MQGLRAEGAEDESLPLLWDAHPIQETGESLVLNRLGHIISPIVYDGET